MERVDYSELNARQQENYNFFKLAAKLSDYGFYSHRLTDDWNGADLIATHLDGKRFLKVQLKGRLTLDRRYRGKDIFIAFRVQEDWYMYPHDEMVDLLNSVTNYQNTQSWEQGSYAWPTIPNSAREILHRFRLE